MNLLEEITARIVQQIDPDRIILFGSYGGEDRDKSSDIDLLIIEETDKRPVDRRMEVEKILSDRNYPLDIFVWKWMKPFSSIASTRAGTLQRKGCFPMESRALKKPPRPLTLLIF